MPKKIHIAASAAIHAIIIIAIFWNSEGRPSKDQSIPQVLLETELIKPEFATALSSTNESTNKKEESSKDQAHIRIEYAGAPMRVRQPTKQPEVQDLHTDDFSSLASDSLLAQQEQVTTSQSFDLEQLYMPADLLKTEGIQAPAFTIAGLSIDQMEKIVANGQGIFIVISGEDLFRVGGQLGNPSNLTPVNSEDLVCFSQRALNVPSSSCGQIRSKLQWDFGVSPDVAMDARVRLLLTNSIDHMILARQKQIATSLGLDLKDVVRTIGKFSFLNGKITDFHIALVILKDGRMLSVEKNSVKGIVSKLTNTFKGAQDNEG